MKKIYAIYCVLELVDQPTWLKEFRTRYDVDYPLHITLKQMAYVDEAEFPKIKANLERILKDASFMGRDIRLIFDTVIAEEHDTSDGRGYIYIFASKRNDYLDALQKSIREQFAECSEYLLKESRTYEYDFRPHVTIGRGLDEGQLKQALAALPTTAQCVGRVANITLSFVKEVNPTEASNLKNLTVYRVDKIHSLDLYARPFNNIKNGTKTTELRINSENYADIQRGDIINFTNRDNPGESLNAEVTYRKVYSSFATLYEGVKHLYPDWTKDAFVESMYKIYTEEQEARYGVLEIGIMLRGAKKAQLS